MSSGSAIANESAGLGVDRAIKNLYRPSLDDVPVATRLGGPRPAQSQLSRPRPEQSATPKPPTVQMPAPAPPESVPFCATTDLDMHTRLVMLGSLARTCDASRLFWQSVRMPSDEKFLVSCLAPSEVRAGDVLFVARQDNLVSCLIRLWTQSAFSHVALAADADRVLDSYPTKDVRLATRDSFLRECGDESTRVWVVRPAELPADFAARVASVLHLEYDSENTLFNMVRAGCADGPDHAVPFPWPGHQANGAPGVAPRVARLEERSGLSCAELIARVYGLGSDETAQWLPANLFARLAPLGAVFYL